VILAANEVSLTRTNKVVGQGRQYVDLDDQGAGSNNRYEKKSFHWYKEVIATNDEKI